MKKYELQPTDANIVSTFRDDLIGRNKNVIYFSTLLNQIDSSCAIALDGKWGSGKTFFVKQVKMVLEMCGSPYKDALSEDCTFVQDYVRNCMQGNGDSVDFQPQVVVYYDAWENDDDTDPVLSVIYEILQNVTTDNVLRKGKGLLHAAGTIAEFITGKKVNALLDLAKAEDPLDQIKKQKSIRALISEFLNALLPEQGNRLVIFVDELDRCKPSYAVRLLEQIKHYFSNDRVTFVFAVNIDQLQHTIKQYYGKDFDACQYLNRFFDLCISLPVAELSRYYHRLGLNDNHNVYKIVCREVIQYYNFELREIAKFNQLAEAAENVLKKHLQAGYSHDQTRIFCLQYVVPVILGTQINDFESYKALIHGKDSSPLIEVINSGISSGRLQFAMFNMLCNSNETYYGPRQQKKVQVKLSDKIGNVYHALFIQNYYGSTSQVNIGEMCFDLEIQEYIMRVVNLLPGTVTL